MIPRICKANLILVFIFIFVELRLSGQNQVVWQGGTPGREKHWECTKNWVGNELPDEFSNVLIPAMDLGNGSFPELEDQDVAINSLRIEGGTVLTILPKGSLTVYAWATYSKERNVDLQGFMFLRNEHLKETTISVTKGLAFQKLPQQ